jgi:2',3'-cyclic-nucleotide 2'-phosphodiesterase
MKLLFIGDIVGRPGRDLVRVGIGALVAHHGINLVIANGENSAGGNGITREIGDSLIAQGVDVITSGNHVWDKKEVFEYIGVEPRLIRPLNYPDAPGRGSYVARTADGRSVGVLNLMGRVHMANLDDPFRAADREVTSLAERTRIIFVDFHAEATSEKIAMGWFLDGRVTAVVGTHTHVQTADERVLPGGTAYITDVGMTGPHDGVIGVEKAPVIQKFLSGMPTRFEAASGDPILHGVLVTADDASGKATGITRLSLTLDELNALAADLPDEKAAAGRG